MKNFKNTEMNNEKENTVMKNMPRLTALIIAIVMLLSTFALADTRTGSTVTFGVYEQDGSYNNGAEPLVWKVLTVQNGKALLVTEKVIDWFYYNNYNTEVTWGTSSICMFLNDEFYNSAFTDAEKAAIQVNYEADAKRVFLLSEQEARTYFGGNNQRMAYPTSHTLSQGAWTWAVTGGTTYWLRDTIRPFGTLYSVAKLITGSGDFDLKGETQHQNRRGVRPAIWVDVDAL